MKKGSRRPASQSAHEVEPEWEIGISATCVTSTAACLEQLLAAVADIADRDDIHQAAERLRLVQDWIDRETAHAAADPMFAPLRLAS